MTIRHRGLRLDRPLRLRTDSFDRVELTSLFLFDRTLHPLPEGKRLALVPAIAL